MRYWFRSEPSTVRHTVFGPHPVQIGRQIDALYSLDLTGVFDAMRRRHAASGVNGSTWRGYGPVEQTFGRTYGFQPAMSRVPRSSLPNSGGSSVSPASSMVDLLGRTVG